MKFRVKARKREANAKTQEFIREAEQADEIVQALQSEGFLVVSVEDADKIKKGFFSQKSAKLPAGQEAAKKKSGLSNIALFEKVKSYELASFIIQFIALMRAGIPILRALNIVSKGLKKGLMKKVVESTIDRISQGFSLSSAFAMFPKVFPSFWLGLIEAGEASGTLPDVLEEIQKYQESSQKFKSKVISAMIYPMILICFAIGAITIFMVKVIPTFEMVFKSMGRGKKLPEVTQFVLNTSRFLQANIQWILIVITVLVVTFQILNRKRQFKKWFDSFKLQIPLIKNFIMEVSIVRFSRGLATMVRSGIPILRAMEISSKLTGNILIEDRLLHSREDLKQGHTLAAPLAKYEVFPDFVTQLISVGEESGQLEKFLDVIANFYEQRVDATVQRISVSIEPIIILFMGVVVGTLVISMFLPLIQISTGG